MKHCKILDLDIEYIDIAATEPGRPTLVLLHEGLGCVAMWRDFPRKLAAASGGRVLAYSRPGYGGSQAYVSARTPRYMHHEAEVALPALLAELAIEAPILVGHSDGGSIALIHAAAYPQGPQAIAVMAPHEFVEEETLAGIRKACEVWQTTDWPQKLARYHRDAARVFADWSDTWLSPAFRDWNIEACLASIRCPVLAMQGLGDEYATLRQIDVIAEESVSVELLKLPDCGHSPHKDQEAAVLAALVGFVDRVSGSCRK